LLALLSLGVVSAPAQGGVLASFLVNGTNLLEDDSRELFIDIVAPTPGVVSIDPGDVLIGFSKFEKINGVDPLNTVYAVFSQTFATISPDMAPGPTVFRTFTFAPTVIPGLTLDDLYSGAIAGGPTGMVALVSGAVPFDLGFGAVTGLEDGSAGVTIFDHLAILEATTMLDAVFGIGLDPGPPPDDDFFSGFTNPALTFDYVSDLSTIPPGFTGTLAFFEAGLSLLHNAMPTVTIFPETQDPGTGTLHDALVLSGTARIPTALENSQGAFTFADDADLRFDARVVPEPGTFAIWGGIFGIGACGAWVRRRRA
jgi:hypothetical protein